MDKKLEARIARLERLLGNRKIKNEKFQYPEDALREAIDLDLIDIKNLCKAMLDLLKKEEIEDLVKKFKIADKLEEDENDPLTFKRKM